MDNTFVALHGEGGQLNKSNNLLDERRISEIRAIISEYSVEQIFNLDKFSLFYRILPSSTYLLENENKKKQEETKR